jgi:inosine-uridine nucleoside N-ribohydrolase
LEKFEGKTHVPTFNLNGHKDGARKLLEHKAPKRFIGKNVCHCISYDEIIHERFKNEAPKNIPQNLVIEGMTFKLRKSGPKCYHDPIAAVCMIHPEIATWIQGTPLKEKGKWTTILDNGNCECCVDVDRNKLWTYLIQGK